MNDQTLLEMAWAALKYHEQQTRPIEGTSIAIAALEARLGKSQPTTES